MTRFSARFMRPDDIDRETERDRVREKARTRARATGRARETDYHELQICCRSYLVERSPFNSPYKVARKIVNSFSCPSTRLDRGKETPVVLPCKPCTLPGMMNSLMIVLVALCLVIFVAAEPSGYLSPCSDCARLRNYDTVYKQGTNIMSLVPKNVYDHGILYLYLNTLPDVNHYTYTDADKVYYRQLPEYLPGGRSSGHFSPLKGFKAPSLYIDDQPQSSYPSHM